MAPGDNDREATSSVSIEDFNRLETLVTTSIESHDSQMKELREMMKLLLPIKPASASIALDDDTDDPLKGDPKLVESKDGNSEGETKIDGSPIKRKDGYNNVAHNYPTPDPIIPHPRINNCGDPPKLDTSAFISWSKEMKSHIKSSSIELWRIIEQGYKPHDASNLSRRHRQGSLGRSIRVVHWQ